MSRNTLFSPDGSNGSETLRAKTADKLKIGAVAVKNTLSNLCSLETFRTKAAALGLASVALAACGGEAKAFDPSEARTVRITDGTIFDMNFREQPEIVDPDIFTKSNSCYKADGDTPIKLGPQDVYVVPSTGANANPDWIGLDLNNLPPKVRKACEGDEDNKVFVSRDPNSVSLTTF